MQAPPTTPTRLIMTPEHIEKLEVAPKPKPTTSRLCFNDDHWVTPVKLNFDDLQISELERSVTKLSIDECDDSGFMESPEYSSPTPTHLGFPMTENRMEHLRRIPKCSDAMPCVASEATSNRVLPEGLNFDDVQEKEVSEDEATSPPTTPPSTPTHLVITMTAERMAQLLRAPKCSRTMPRISPEAGDHLEAPQALNFDEESRAGSPSTTPPTTPPRVAMPEERVQQLLRAPRSNRRTMRRISPEAEVQEERMEQLPRASRSNQRRMSRISPEADDNLAAPVALNFDDYDFGAPVRLHFDDDTIKADEAFMFEFSDSEDEDDTSESQDNSAENA
uniref:Protein aurora borealis n=1 Tax=Panagrellus redivivus TaxID=6233 RepID=A0A7E4WCG2_PANRE